MICWVLIQCFPVFCLFPSCSGCVPKTFWHIFRMNYLWLCQKFSQVSWFSKSFCKVSPLRIWLSGNALFHFTFFPAWGFKNRPISPSLEQVMLSLTYISKWYLTDLSAWECCLKTSVFCTKASFLPPLDFMFDLKICFLQTFHVCFKLFLLLVRWKCKIFKHFK